MTRRWTTAAVGATLLGGAWMALQRPVLQRADVVVGDALRRAGTPGLDRLVAGTTDIGSIYGVVGTAAALAAAGRRLPALDALGVGGLTWAVAQANKTFVRRQRPYQAHGVRRLIRPPTGSSFPSGHAAVGMGVMAALAASTRGARSAAALHTLGSYVGVSRVYVGVHYPTDSIGGAGLGLLVAALWRGPLGPVGRGLVRLTARTVRRLAGIR